MLRQMNERSEIMKRRITALVLCVALLVLSVLPVSAEENTTQNNAKIVVTNEMAIEMAQNFVDQINPDDNLLAGDPLKFYDMNGQAIGYIVNYYKENIPYGYVIFDNSNDDLISEYSFGENSLNPYTSIKSNSNVATFSEEDATLYKMEPFTYGVYNSATGEMLDNYGDKHDVPISTFSNKPAEWEDVLLDTSEINASYSIISTNNLNNFYAFGESYIENLTGHYACLVSSLYTCASFFGALNYSDVKGDYMQLWNDTKTSTTEVKNGITYGSTDIYQGASGFEQFCRRKGINISTYTYDSVVFDFFTAAIDKGMISVVHAGIYSASEQTRSGHSMTVEGYASVSEKNTGKDIDMLMVFDGWNEYIRYLNFDFNGWMDLRGTNFAYS